jgi:hypothetical protein
MFGYCLHLNYPTVHHRIHNSQLSQLNPLHTRPANLPKTHSDPILPSTLCLPFGLFPSGFPTKYQYIFLSSPMRATCPAHLILFALICLMISGKEYNLGSYRLHLTFKLLGNSTAKASNGYVWFSERAVIVYLHITITNLAFVT